MRIRRTSRFTPRGAPLGALGSLMLSVSLLGHAWGTLSSSTERMRRLIAEHDFPASEPVMDTRQQFIVFSPDQRLSRELLDVAVRLRQRIYHFFGVSRVWDQPAFVLIFPTRERYGLLGTGGAAMYFKYRGQDIRIIASYLQEGLKDKILPHEMVHFLIRDLSAVGAPRQGEPPQLPIFINEGIAEYFSAHQGRRILFEKAVWEAFGDRKLESFKEIITSTATWEEAVLPGESSWVRRAQAYSVISFLASLPNGNVKLRNYIMSYGTLASRVTSESASPKAFEMAFRQDYSSWRELEERWMRYIGDREFVVIEAELATIRDSSGEKSEVKRAPRRRLWLSGGRELRFPADGAGSFLTLQSSMPAAGACDVYAIYVRRPTAGQFRLAVNGQEFPKIADGYARTESVSEPVHMGKSVIPRGKMTLRFSVVGKQVISRGFDIGIDCLLLRRDRQLEQKNKASAQRRLEAGTRDFRRRRFKEAEAKFTEAINLVPDNALAMEWRAHARMARGKIDEAEEDVDAAIELDPPNPRLQELKKQIEAAKEKKSPREGQDNDP